MKPTPPNRDALDSSALVLGTLIGLLLGGLAALFLSPRSGPQTRHELSRTGQQLRTQLEEAVTPSDPLEESMAEGKAAARRRRSELGLP